MFIKVINTNDKILKTLLDTRDVFKICELKSKLLHFLMHESSMWKQVVSAEYIQAAIFTQMPSNALTKSSLSNYFPLIIAMLPVFILAISTSNRPEKVISLLLMFI